ncbi:MAG TPA: RluA family pseudouridine synthase [Chthoniobacteraceae bacterium]|nr:RluA family pseudouridine synthase [Chthoniobacteraceae bacterium]
MKEGVRTNRNFRIVAESGDWIVVDKPPFLEAHPSKPRGAFTLWNGLRELLAFEIANGGQVSIINRLDRETSGLTLVCKTAASARRFAGLMEERRIHKEYLAIVFGWPARDEYEIDAPLARLGAHGFSRIWLKQGVHPLGAEARTRVRVEKRFEKNTTNGNRFSLVRAMPQTGRTHQIRVHMAHIGHPLVGDKIYGPDEGHYLTFIETGWTPELERELLLPRHALHCTKLKVNAGEETLEWDAPLAEDLAGWVTYPAS